MTEATRRLAEIAEQLKRGEKPEPETVRTLLGWFDTQRRGYAINKIIEKSLHQFGITTQPDFRYAYIDSPVTFVRAGEGSKIEPEQIVEADKSADSIIETAETVGGAIQDPTYRIGRLPAANQPLFTVTPNSTLQQAVTLMLTNNVSQLPVMTSEREVKGMISWSSVGSRLAVGNQSDSVSHYMETHRELNANVSIFAAIAIIAEHDYVLIRDDQKKITGIVTTSDLSLQFHQLGEPFLLIGEIENHIRRLIDGKFTSAELKAISATAEPDREVSSVADLTFGDYIWLLKEPPNWDRLGLLLDRNVFIERLDKVREIRNEVMHFDPDPLENWKLEILRETVQFLQKLREITDKKS
jgi:CBS domain-containing protein